MQQCWMLSTRSDSRPSQRCGIYQIAPLRRTSAIVQRTTTARVLDPPWTMLVTTYCRAEPTGPCDPARKWPSLPRSLGRLSGDLGSILRVRPLLCPTLGKLGCPSPAPGPIKAVDAAPASLAGASTAATVRFVDATRPHEETAHSSMDNNTSITHPKDPDAGVTVVVAGQSDCLICAAPHRWWTFTECPLLWTPNENTVGRWKMRARCQQHGGCHPKQNGPRTIPGPSPTVMKSGAGAPTSESAASSIHVWYWCPSWCSWCW